MTAVSDRVEIDIPDDIPTDISGGTGADWICESCGAVRNSESALKIHTEAEHPRKGARASSRVSESDGSSVPRQTRTRAKSEDRQIKDLKKSILEEFNPFMITTLSQTGIPIGMMDGTLPTGRTVRQELEFGETEADIIARGIVKLKGTAVAESTLNLVGPLLPYAFGIVALIVVGMHAVKVWVLRGGIIKQLQLMQAPQDGDGNQAQYV